MPRTEDSVWKNFSKVTNVKGEVVKRMCMHCKAEFVPNATCAKKHLVAHCPKAQLSVKQQFLSDVNKQCFIGKRKVTLEGEEESVVQCKQTISSPHHSCSTSTSSATVPDTLGTPVADISSESNSGCESEVMPVVESGNATEPPNTSDATSKLPVILGGSDDHDIP